MADIELVIKIPESTYKVFKNLSKIIGVLVYEKDILTIIKAVKNGTPLPKGHGRLVDADAIEGHPRYDCEGFKIGEDFDWEDIKATPTIIEADKEQKDGNDNC